MTNPLVNDSFRRQLGRSQLDRSAPFVVIVKAIDNQREIMTTDDDSKETEIRFPFTSANSWMRSMPSAGIRAVVAYNKDDKKLEFLGYQNVKAEDAITAYKAGTGLYRPLREGEHDIMSSGKASSYWGSQPVKVDRAGMVSTRLDGLKLEAMTHAPTVIWRGTRNRPDIICHEMRFGAVKRPTSAAKESYALKIGSAPEAGTAIYANEFLMAINADLTDAPLVDARFGEVFDDYLSPGYPMANPRYGSNNLPLRAHVKYFVTAEPGSTPMVGQSTDYEVDTLGNVSLTLSKLSLTGVVVKAPVGKIAVSAGLDMSFDAQGNITITTLGKITLNGKMGIDLTTAGAVTIAGDQGVSIKSSTGPVSVESTVGSVEVNGKTGVSLIGALGKTNRPIATLSNDPVTGAPLFLDPSLST